MVSKEVKNDSSPVLKSQTSHKTHRYYTHRSQLMRHVLRYRTQ